MTEDIYCTMNLRLSRRGGAVTMYDAKLGVRRRLQLRGFVHDFGWMPGDGPDDGAPHFHGKPVAVQVRTPADPAKFEQLGAGLSVDTAQRIFGVVTVSAGVRIEKVEVGGESHELEPVIVVLHVTPDAFDAIERQTGDADAAERTVFAKITLAGPTLPQDKATRIDEVFGLRLKDLDVSVAREYLVRSFDLSDSSVTEPLRGRVRELPRQAGEGHTVTLPVLVAESGYECSMERGIIHSITCRGCIKGTIGRHYEGEDVEIEFRPYDLHAGHEPPRQSAFGAFAYWTRQGADAGHFFIALNYLEEDALKIILPLISGSARSEVTILIELIASQQDLDSKEECVRGEIQTYGFRVRREHSHP